MRLEGKTALVTGSDQGIGKAIAIRFAQEGADVVINYNKNADHAQETLAEVEATGRKGFHGAGRSFADRRYQAAGGRGVWRISASSTFWSTTRASRSAPISGTSPKTTITSSSGVNQTGVFFTTQRFVQHLRDAKQTGKIVNISSVHEELPFPHFTAYCMSKGALKMMTRNLAVELGPLGININNIAPGAIETPINTKLMSDPQLLASLTAADPARAAGKARGRGFPGGVSGVV